MKVDKVHRPKKRLALWTAICTLSLFAAMVFVAPPEVFAQITGELSQGCETALVGTEHSITAKVTDGGAPPTSTTVYFYSTDPDNYGSYFEVASFDDGIATFTYTADSVGPVEITLFYVAPDYSSVELDVITTTWTDNEADLCSSSQSVLVGGRITLNVNAKKRGAMKIAVCAADGMDVNNVDLESVQLVGVAPWRSKYKDSRLCPGGKDGVKDLVLKFKNRELVEALEVSLGELADGDLVDLALTGSLNDGTALEGEWTAEIKKKGNGKKKCKTKVKEKKKKKKKKKKKEKMAKN